MSPTHPRFTPQNAPDVIPIFPLPGALLLPRGRLPLNIFEPRYLAMVDDALKTEHRLIGMVQPKSSETRSSGTELYDVGCAGRIVTFSETDDGRYMIAIEGISRFKISEEIEGFQPYRRAAALWDDYAHDTHIPTQDDPSFDKSGFLNLVSTYFKAKGLDTDWDALDEADEETIINGLSMMCPFSASEKQALLEAPSMQQRRDTLGMLFKIDAAGEESRGLMQ